MILGVTGLTEAIGGIRENSSRKSDEPIIYDSDEEPSSLPRRASVSLTYSSTRSREGNQNNDGRIKRKTGLFCCVARKISKKHLPTP